MPLILTFSFLLLFIIDMSTSASICSDLSKDVCYESPFTTVYGENVVAIGPSSFSNDNTNDGISKNEFYEPIKKEFPTFIKKMIGFVKNKPFKSSGENTSRYICVAATPGKSNKRDRGTRPGLELLVNSALDLNENLIEAFQLEAVKLCKTQLKFSDTLGYIFIAVFIFLFLSGCIFRYILPKFPGMREYPPIDAENPNDGQPKVPKKIITVCLILIFSVFGIIAMINSSDIYDQCYTETPYDNERPQDYGEKVDSCQKVSETTLRIATVVISLALFLIIGYPFFYFDSCKR